MAVFTPEGGGLRTEAEVRELTGKTSEEIDTATRNGHRLNTLDRHATQPPSLDPGPGVWGISRRNGGRRGGSGF